MLLSFAIKLHCANTADVGMFGVAVQDKDAQIILHAGDMAYADCAEKRALQPPGCL